MLHNLRLNFLTQIQNSITQNTTLYFRGVLFLTFFGHGLASLGFSHEGYELHHRIFESVNYFDWDAGKFLMLQGWWDILLGFMILSGIFPRYVLIASLTYLCMVAIVGYLYYHARTGSFFGFGETLRRFAWIFYSIFLWLQYTTNRNLYSLLRMGISFGFLSHGFASLGFFGMRGGQIELASQVFSHETATLIIFCSGFSDVLLGAMLFSGFFSRYAAVLGTCWLVVVVVLSFMLGIPEGIFRSGFLFSCVYVALDKRCHFPVWKSSGSNSAST